MEFQERKTQGLRVAALDPATGHLRVRDFNRHDEEKAWMFLCELTDKFTGSKDWWTHKMVDNGGVKPTWEKHKFTPVGRIHEVWDIKLVRVA